MKIISESTSFNLLLRVFRKNVSSGSCWDLRPIQEGEAKIGPLKGLSQLVYSQIQNLETYRLRLTKEEIPISTNLDTTKKILADCLKESVMSTYPIATFCGRFEIREGPLVVVPADAFSLEGIDHAAVVGKMADFFPQLQQILMGAVLYASVPEWERVPGHLVGYVREAITKQLALFRWEVVSWYQPYLNWTEKQTHDYFEEREHWRYLLHHFSVMRMQLQLEIINKILLQAIWSQGFNTDLVSEFAVEHPINLSLGPNWEIIVPMAV